MYFIFESLMYYYYSYIILFSSPTASVSPLLLKFFNFYHFIYENIPIYELNWLSPFSFAYVFRDEFLMLANL